MQLKREFTEAEFQAIYAVTITVQDELVNAMDNFPAMRSAHEGYAVLKEEVDELWEAVRMKQRDPGRLPQMRKEAVQVAAMAMRFLIDICDQENNE
jgi:hypothetical protein